MCRISDTICVRCPEREREELERRLTFSGRTGGGAVCGWRRTATCCAFSSSIGVTFGYYRSSLILAALHGRQTRVSSVMRININAPFQGRRARHGCGCCGARRLWCGRGEREHVAAAAHSIKAPSACVVLMDAHYVLAACVWCVYVFVFRVPQRRHTAPAVSRGAARPHVMSLLICIVLRCAANGNGQDIHDTHHALCVISSS